MKNWGFFWGILKKTPIFYSVNKLQVEIKNWGLFQNPRGVTDFNPVETNKHYFHIRQDIPQTVNIHFDHTVFLTKKPQCMENTNLQFYRNSCLGGT